MKSRKKKYAYIGFIVGFEVVAFVSGFSVGGKFKAKSVKNCKYKGFYRKYKFNRINC